MKKKVFSLNVLLPSLTFAVIIFFACGKSDFSSSANRSDIARKSSLSSTVSTALLSCLDTYSMDDFGWAVTYPCPQNNNQLLVNSNDIKREKRIDSIIKANSIKYPTTTPTITKLPLEQPTNFLIYLYGPTIADISQELGYFYLNKPATVTVYVLEYGQYGGAVYIGTSQAGYFRCVGFYPDGASGNSSAIVPISSNIAGKFCDNTGLAYSVSVSINNVSRSQLTNVVNYITNGLISTPYSYNFSSMNGAQLAVNAASRAGLSFPNFSYGNSSPAYALAQAIKTMTAPTNGSINLTGGIVPDRLGDGSYIP